MTHFGCHGSARDVLEHSEASLRSFEQTAKELSLAGVANSKLAKASSELQPKGSGHNKHDKEGSKSLDGAQKHLRVGGKACSAMRLPRKISSEPY